METDSKIEQARSTAEKAKEIARDLTEKARYKARDAGVAADLYLHEHAWSTLVMVALAACTLGFLLGRRDT